MKLALPLFARWVLRWEETLWHAAGNTDWVTFYLISAKSPPSSPLLPKEKHDHIFYSRFTFYFLVFCFFLNKRTRIIIYYIKSKHWREKVKILVGKIITVSYLSQIMYLLYLTLSSLWKICVSKKFWGVNLFPQHQRMLFLCHFHCFLIFLIF